MRLVLPTMGTVASIEIDADPARQPALESVATAVLSGWEETFSLHRPDSPLARVAAGTLALADTPESVRGVYARALEWSSRTNGTFTPHRPDGVLDLNGIVKALAIEALAGAIEASGCPTYAISVGGDILCSPRSADLPLTAGIADPDDRGRVLTAVTLSGSRRAMATSGSAERGDHIWLGGRTAPAEFVQVSVIADDIVTADVLATAIVAGGREGLDDASDRFDIDVLTIDRDGELLATPGLRRSLAAR